MNKFQASSVRGIMDFPGNTLNEQTANLYKNLGEWFKENAEILAADSNPRCEAVPITIEININNQITTIEKKTSYYLTEVK
ncbi:hypothetical protein [Anaerocolumna jejuensis]|uniref:hypothetical protein n=1 Tax=Anaerocolumna jejuensis TaxID=259063 RepID=UPI003F7B6BB7